MQNRLQFNAILNSQAPSQQPSMPQAQQNSHLQQQHQMNITSGQRLDTETYINPAESDLAADSQELSQNHQVRMRRPPGTLPTSQNQTQHLQQTLSNNTPNHHHQHGQHPHGHGHGQHQHVHNQMSISSIQSPIVNGNMMNVNRQMNMSLDEETSLMQQEPMAFLQPPQMMQQSDSFHPFQSESTLPQPYYYNLKRIQELVGHTVQNFPMQDNQDFFDNNYEKIIETSATQIEFLYNKLQSKHQSLPIPQLLTTQNAADTSQHVTASFQNPNQTNSNPNNYTSSEQKMQSQIMMQESQNNMSRMIAENQSLKSSLTKADEIVKNLRVENEYFQKQLESLRNEVETAKMNPVISQQTTKARSLDRISRNDPYNNNRENQSTFQISADTSQNHNFNNGYEPQLNMPQPMPHPRQNLPQMTSYHDEEPFFARRQHRDLSATPTSNSFNVVGPIRQSSKESRENNPNGTLPSITRRSGTASASTRRQIQRKAPPPFTPQAVDQNNKVEYLGTAVKDKKVENDDNIDQEVKQLRFELSQQTEVILLKTETINNLQSQLEQQKRRMTTDASKVQNELTSEVDALKKELELCKNDEVVKEASMQELKRQVAELFKSKTIEMNLLMNKPPQEFQTITESQPSAQKQSTNKSSTKMNSKASKNLQFAKDLNAEMELMFADDDFQIKPSAAGKRQKRKDRENKNRQVQFQPDEKQSRPVPQTAASNMINPELLLQNQIQAAQLAETLINEVARLENGQTSEVTDLTQSCQSLEEHAKTLMKEKKLLTDKVTELSKINDDLKRKFSSLLDQFQEYVTLQEENKLTEEDKQKQQQETLLTNMQNNIKELENVTESLQNELQNKEEVFEVLKKEKRELEEKLEAKTKEESENSKNAMQRIQDELGFQKKHHELEINMLKEQYERSLETAKLIAVETAKVNHQQAQQQQQQQQPPREQMNQDIVTFPHNSSLAVRTESVRLSDQLPFLQNAPNQSQQQTPVQTGIDPYYHHQPSCTYQQSMAPPLSPHAGGHTLTSQGPSINQMHQQHQQQQIAAHQTPTLYEPSPQSIPLRQPHHQPIQMYEHSHQAQHHEHHLQRTDPSPPTNHRSKDVIHPSASAIEKMKRDLIEKEHLLEEKNREILHLRMANEEQQNANGGGKRANSQNQKQPFVNTQSTSNQIDSELRGQLIQDLTYSVGSLRTELNRVKQTMFVQIGKHINFDAPSNLIDQNRQIAREEDLHSEIIIQLSEIRALVALTQEIGMLAQSSLTASKPRADSTSPLRNPSPISKPTKPNRAVDAKTSHDTNYQIKRNADAMLRQNHASGLHELVLEQVTRSETLMADNELMQRQLYKYETTLAELDVILRSDKREQTNYELKKLVENQLKQIIALQKEVDMARTTEMKSPERHTSALKPPQTDNIGASLKELETLKYELREQRLANEELISERRNMMDLIENQEQQVKESNRQMEKALNKVGSLEKDNQDKALELEDIRQRVTKVAELFERKEIKQKYSFEVLCDFVHDKAKRLFSKYDNLAKERKVMQEEKNFYFQRKLDQLEQENFQMKETTRAAERIIHELVPCMAQLLERPLLHNRELSEYYYARQVLEQLEIEFRTLKKSHQILQERNDDLKAQIDAIQQRGLNPIADYSGPSTNQVVQHPHTRNGAQQQQHQQSTIDNCAPTNHHHNSHHPPAPVQRGGSVGPTSQERNSTESLPVYSQQQRHGAGIPSSANQSSYHHQQARDYNQPVSSNISFEQRLNEAKEQAQPPQQQESHHRQHHHHQTFSGSGSQVVVVAPSHQTSVRGENSSSPINNKPPQHLQHNNLPQHPVGGHPPHSPLRSKPAATAGSRPTTSHHIHQSDQRPVESTRPLPASENPRPPAQQTCTHEVDHQDRLAQQAAALNGGYSRGHTSHNTVQTQRPGSVERNIRHQSPPAKQLGVTSATLSYQGMMGSHLPSAENQNK